MQMKSQGDLTKTPEIMIMQMKSQGDLTKTPEIVYKQNTNYHC